MTNSMNGVLSFLGVKFPASQREAYANVRWKLSVLTRCSQVVISTVMGCIGLGLDRYNCFTEHPVVGSAAPTLSTTLSIPLGNGSAGPVIELSLTTISSLVATNNTTSSGGNETDSILTTLASIVTGNVTDSSGGNGTDSTLALLVASGTGSAGRANGPRDYCLPIATLLGLYSGILCVFTVVKMIKRCLNGRRQACRVPLIYLQDGLLVMASGLGCVGNVLIPTCYPGAGGPYPQVCDRLGAVVLLSSVLYLTHAGVLVFSAVCANSSVQRKRQTIAGKESVMVMMNLGGDSQS